MKKYMWLLVMVLGMSTTAWGACTVDIWLTTENPVCGQTVEDEAMVYCSGQCTYVGETRSQVGNHIYFDVYLNCTDLSGDSTVHLGPGPILEDAPCGLYVTIVRVWCTYEGPECWPYSMFGRPIFCGMGANSFTVCCADCCCFPCCCWMIP